MLSLRHFARHSFHAISIVILLVPAGRALYGQSRADERYAIEGRMIDSTTGEPIAGGTIRIEPVGRTTSGDEEGTFHIGNLAAGSYILIADALGYQTREVACPVPLRDGDAVEIPMSRNPLVLPDVVVQAQRIAGRTSVSDFNMDAETLRSSQGLLEDPVRTLTTLPGVAGGTDLFSPTVIYIRGGAPEENLFLLDNVKLYWPWYFGGMKSVYNTGVVDRVELLTGGFPASFGNHMSSVLNVSTRSGDFRNWHGGFSFGFFNAAADIEGPIVRDKLSVLASVRRTYLDLFLDESAEFPVPTFGDLTYKIAYHPSRNHRISLSGLSSDESIDFLSADPQPGLPDRIRTGGGAHTQSAEWLAVFGEDVVSRLAVTHATSTSTFAIGETIDAAIEGTTWGVRQKLEWQLNDKGRAEFGFEGYDNSFTLKGTFPLDPSETDPNDTTIRLRPFDIASVARLGGAYALYDGDLMENLGFNAGVRIDAREHIARPDISPRIALRYRPSRRLAFRAAFGDYRQFPADDALQYNPDLSSALCRHYIAGVQYNFSESISGWIEGYVKDYSNLTLYDSLLRYSSDGTGLSRGVEIFLRKEAGQVQGWVSLALSGATRQAPLQDKAYRFDYDQPVIANCELIWSADSGAAWFLPSVVSGQLRYASGRPYTPVLSAVQTPDGWRPVKGEINRSEDPDYLNLNLRLEWRYMLGSSIDAASYFEVWNLTDRKNVLGRTYRYGPEFDNNVRVQPYYTTPLIVGGGFRLRF